MGDINHFTYGVLTPGVAYLMSCIGSALGLTCTTRARAASGAERVRWVILAAVSIGGAGIWVMHFIGMLGFSVRGTPIRYDAARTLVSLLLAVVVVGIGMAVAGRREAGIPGLLLGGLITGGGVALMHYLGMAAMSMHGEVDYDPWLVAASVLIAVVAATVALWFALNVNGALAIGGASLLMGVAVSGMHYTGMFAMDVHVETDGAAAHGLEAATLLAPLVIGISAFTLITLSIVGLSPTADEIRDENELEARAARLAIRHNASGVLPRVGVGTPHHPRRNGAPDRRPSARSRSRTEGVRD